MWPCANGVSLCVCTERETQGARGLGVGPWGAHWPPVTCKLINMPLSATARLWFAPPLPACFVLTCAMEGTVCNSGWVTRSHTAQLLGRQSSPESKAWLFVRHHTEGADGLVKVPHHLTIQTMLLWPSRMHSSELFTWTIVLSQQTLSHAVLFKAKTKNFGTYCEMFSYNRISNHSCGEVFSTLTQKVANILNDWLTESFCRGTCDVSRSQFREGQNNGCGSSLSWCDTLLPGEVVPPRMANKLDALWNWYFNMNLWERGEERRGESDRATVTSSLPATPPPSYSVFPSKLWKQGRIFKSHCEFSMLTDSCFSSSLKD